MGASVSRSNTQIVNESIISAVVESSQQTTNYTKSTQSMELSGFNFGVSQIQDLSTSIAALKEVQVDNKMLDKIVQNIKNNTKAEGVLLNPAYAESDVEIKNVVSANFNTETLQSCVSAVEAAQTLKSTEGSINIFIKQKQTVEQLSKCNTIMDISNKIAKQSMQTTRSTTTAESKSWFEGIFGNPFSITIMVIVLLIIFAIIGSLSKKKKGKRRGRKRGRRRSPGRSYRPSYPSYQPQPYYIPPPPPPPPIQPVYGYYR